MRRTLLLTGACLLPLLCAAGDPDRAGDLAELRDRFQAHLAAGEPSAALPLAERVVGILESEGSSPAELAAALDDVGAAARQLNELDRAEKAYQRSLELLEASSGISMPQLVAPLAGLAAVYAARGQHERATEQLRLAIAISRRAQGLFNLAQLELLERLVASLRALGDEDGVLLERRYALQVLEHNYTRGDPRTLPAVLALAQEYERTARHRHARAMYGRSLEIGASEGGANSALVLRSLVAIARNHRLQFVSDPKSVGEKTYYTDTATGKRAAITSLEPYSSPEPDRNGYKAIREALAALRRVDDPPPHLLSEVLLEFGDWEITRGSAAKALPYYAEAARVHATFLPEQADPLAQPRLVVYRPPVASRRNAIPLIQAVAIRTATFRLSVDEDGEARDITLLEHDTSDVQTDFLRRALAEARYSPRFEKGSAVPTEDVVFIGRWEVPE